MKWKEMSAFHKVLLFFALACAIAYLILCFFDSVDVVEDILESILWLCSGIICWKERRGIAIAAFIFSGLHFICVFIFPF